MLDNYSDNEVLNQIAQEPAWSISVTNFNDKNSQKIPLDIRDYVINHPDSRDNQNYRYQIFSKNRKPWGLTTLPLLNRYEDNIKKLPVNNRAYRFHASDNYVIGLDVENIATNSLKQSMLNLPTQYREFSQHQGMHLLLAIPKEFITDEFKELIDKHTVIKGPKELDANQKPTSKAMVEFIINDHFLTLTGNTLDNQPIIDLRNNIEQQTILKTFINWLIKYAKQHQSGQIQSNHTQQINPDIPKQLQKALKIIIKKDNEKPNPYLHKLKNNYSCNDYGGDESGYEVAMAMRLKSWLAYSAQRNFYLGSPQMVLGFEPQKLTELDFEYLTYGLLNLIVPHRPKTNEYRDDLPWLLYVAHDTRKYMNLKSNWYQEDKAFDFK